MARSGQRIESPCSDEAILFRKTAADTDGALLEFEVEANAGAHTITHIHWKQEERFLVVRGQLNVYIDGQYLICGPGEEAVIPPSIPHRWWNESGKDVTMIVQLRPALNDVRAGLPVDCIALHANVATRRRKLIEGNTQYVIWDWWSDAREHAFCRSLAAFPGIALRFLVILRGFLPYYAVDQGGLDYERRRPSLEPWLIHHGPAMHRFSVDNDSVLCAS